MCDCIKQVNDLLATKNTRLSQAYNLSGSKNPLLMIKTEKLDDSKRQKPVKMFASFCPFCGEEYQK
jgi:hypothetical protein